MTRVKARTDAMGFLSGDKTSLMRKVAPTMLHENHIKISKGKIVKE